MFSTQRTFYLDLRIGSQALLFAQFLDWKKNSDQGCTACIRREGKTDTVSAKAKESPLVLMQAWSFRYEAKCLERKNHGNSTKCTHPFADKV